MKQNAFAFERERERLNDIASAIALCCSLMSLPLYLVFWIADWIYAPQFKWEFLYLRALLIPVNCFVLFLSKRTKTLTGIQNLALFLTAANSVPIGIMMYLTDGIASPYYAGLNLVALGNMCFFDWSRRYLALAVLATYSPYFFLFSSTKFDSHQLSKFILSVFFIAGTIIISMVIRYFQNALKIKELSNRLQLQNELKHREEIIQQKTDEGTKLAGLAKQFSPQVVHSIKSGKLNILNQVRRAHICAIFIDIVNSTDRVVRIDKDDVNKVISMFMEDTMKVLLKYDITIDKFLGDGVLGFSNDPIPHKDFIERTVNAALEIKSRINARQEIYMEHWLNELQIRVGISSGFANVGFYGSDDYFKSYTAIGRVVNLASRLCGSAAPNQILASQDVIKALPETSYHFQCIGNQQLKGFEADLIKTFEITGSKAAEQTAAQSSCAIASCPHGHGVLHLDTDTNGIYVFKCHSCDYIQGSDAANSQKQAA